MGEWFGAFSDFRICFGISRFNRTTGPVVLTSPGDQFLLILEGLCAVGLRILRHPVGHYFRCDLLRVSYM